MITKEQLRAAAPEMAAFVDDMRNVFPGLKVTYVRVDALNFEFGIKPEPQLHQWADSTPITVLKKRWAEQAKADQLAHERRQNTPKSRAMGGRRK